jgi:hypothetical protein
MEVYERVKDDQMGAMGSTRYIVYQAKIWQDNTLTDSICIIVSIVPMDRKVFGCENRSIGKVILLSFHLYKEHPKRSPYVISVIILVRTIPRI